MQEKLLDIGYRKQIIQEIKGDENVQRKIKSYKKHNMQNDNFYQYVKEHLESKLDPETVKEMDIFANVNLQKRISKAESGVYKNDPTREFYNDETEIDDLNKIYNRIGINTVLKRSNVAYKYEDQCTIQMYPEDQELKARVLLPHHFDVISDEMNPEKAMAYVISNFDNTSRDEIRRDDIGNGTSQGDTYRDQVNQKIADYDDQKLSKERFYWWSDSYNFVTNGKGEVLDKLTHEVIIEYSEIDPNFASPLAEYGVKPFVDISTPKDFEYWCRGGDSLFDSTVLYNTILTSEFQTVKMQGHAQAYYKGSADNMPENMRVGVNHVIFLPENPDQPVNSEFGFANPGSDLSGIRQFRESFLAAFLSARGLDTSIISGDSSVKTATSGIEKMLQMIEKFEASQDDFSLFSDAEQKLARLITAWINSLRSERLNGELILDEAYQINLPDPKDVTVNVEFAKPEMIKTDSEILDVLQKEIDMEISSRVHALMEYKGMSLEQAKERIKEIDELEGFNANGSAEILEKGSIPEVQS